MRKRAGFVVAIAGGALIATAGGASAQARDLTFVDCLTSSTVVTTCGTLEHASPEGTNTPINGISDLALSADGGHAYGVGQRFGPGTIVWFSRAPDGALAFGGCLTGRELTSACGAIPGATASGDGSPLDWPASIALSPDGTSAYVSSFRADSITAFSVDPGSGALAFQGCLTADSTLAACAKLPGSNPGGFSSGLNGVGALAASPDGLSVYAISSTAQSIVSFDRDPGSGALTYAGCLTSYTGTTGCETVLSEHDWSGGPLDGINSIVASPDGRHVYSSAAGTASLARLDRDPETGALSYRDCTSSDTFAPCGVRIPGSRADAVRTALNGVRDIALSADGASAYAAAATGDALTWFDRDPQSGALDFRGCLTANSLVTGCTYIPGASSTGTGTGLNSPGDVEVSPGGRRVYAAAPGSDALAIFDRAASGEIAYAGCVTSDLDLDCDDHLPGALPGAAGTALDGVPRVVASPDDLSVYALSPNSDSIARFGYARPELAVRPRVRSVAARRRSVAFRYTVRNPGGAPLEALRVCALPLGNGLDVRGAGCRPSLDLATGGSISGRFRVRLRPPLKRGAAIRIVARSPRAGSSAAVARLRVRR